MKKITLLLLLLVITISANGQNPDMIGTWYFSEFAAGMDDPIPITVEDAPVNPRFTIYSDYHFDGSASCNQFVGQMEFNEDDDYYICILTNYFRSLNDCSSPQYTQFESDFFAYLDSFASSQFYIEATDDTLYMELEPGFGLLFKDTPTIIGGSSVYRLWHLEEMEIDGVTVDVSTIEPAITPTISFSAANNFSAYGACNLMQGPVDLQHLPNITYGDDQNQGPSNCNGDQQVTFETQYFNFFTPGETHITAITDDPDGQSTLTIRNPSNDTLTYRTNQLSSPENSINEISVFPNPTTDKITVVSNDFEFSKITIFNVSGQHIMSLQNTGTTIDVSSLKSGVYFLEVLTDNNKKMIKKFIKK